MNLLRSFSWMLIVAIASACGTEGDDVGSSDGTGTDSIDASSGAPAETSGTGPGTTTNDADASADGEATSPAEDTSPPACDGEFLCVGYDEATCAADPCCISAMGRVYQQSKEGWCLRPEPEYVGCSTAANDPCDYTGSIVCTSFDNGADTYVELEVACFPNGCAVSEPPDTGGIVCPG